MLNRFHAVVAVHILPSLLTAPSSTCCATVEMRLDAAFGVITDLRLGLVGGLWPTILAIWHAPSLLFRPLEISRIFTSHVWDLYGNSVDEGGRSVKKELITPHAYGVVLDLGAGVSPLPPK